MIQDIYPSVIDNSYRAKEPAENSRMISFTDGKLLVRLNEEKQEFSLPCRSEFACAYKAPVFLFSIDDDDYFLTETDEEPEGYEKLTLNDIRKMKLSSNREIFAAFTAYHLWKWYSVNKHCGVCGGKMQHSPKSRSLKCAKCGNKVYPRINPAVIIGVTNGDRLLIIRYREGYRHNALVAGFTEIGETMEQTVRREVMEEVGLKVKNIRYYKSQPWGVASDILMGFYCELDGSDEIKMDASELKYAAWVERGDVVLQPTDDSLTNEMMRMFREGRERESVLD